MTDAVEDQGELAHEEKRAWIMLLVSVAVYAAYVFVVLGLPRPLGLAAVDYGSKLLVAVGISIGAEIFLDMMIGMLQPNNTHKPDLRDREISRASDSLGHWFLVAAGIAVLFMALREVDHFWIANTVYLGFTLLAVVGVLAKIHYYRRGFVHT